MTAVLTELMADVTVVMVFSVANPPPIAARAVRTSPLLSMIHCNASATALMAFAAPPGGNDCIQLTAMPLAFLTTPTSESHTCLNVVSAPFCCNCRYRSWNHLMVPWIAFWMTGVATVKASDTPFIAPVTIGLTESNTVMPALTAAASRLPSEPSMVVVLVAASFAASVMPNCMMALLNSSAVISPLAIASRKLPVYAPFFFIASWSLPDAPGMASDSWFQSSVVSFPAPAVWVSTMATLLKVSELPPATAFRLPAASASFA